MEQLTLGRTGLVVGRLGFGALPIQRSPVPDAVKILQKALEQGVTFFDTARMYTDSEEKIGQALAGARQQIVLATKSMADSGAKLMADLERSLRNLQTDYVDIFQFHFARQVYGPDEENGLYQTMLQAKKQGKIRFIGLTAHALPVAEAAARSGWYDVVQYPLSLLSNQRELELINICKQGNVGLLAMKGLAGGLISNIPAAFAFLHRFANLLPLWGIAHMRELEEFLDLMAHPPEFGPAMELAARQEKLALGEGFCRGCGYCGPCPVGIEMLNMARIAIMMQRMPWQLYATEAWQAKARKAEECIHCGQCAARCPYGLNTEQLVARQTQSYWRILKEKGHAIMAD